MLMDPQQQAEVPEVTIRGRQRSTGPEGLWGFAAAADSPGKAAWLVQHGELSAQARWHPAQSWTHGDTHSFW